MADGDDFVMRPVVERMCLYESITSCKLDLADIARMNDALDVKYENERRAQKASE